MNTSSMEFQMKRLVSEDNEKSFSWKSFIKKRAVQFRIHNILDKMSNNYCTIIAYHSVRHIDEIVEKSIGAGITTEPDIFEKQIHFISEKCSLVEMDDVVKFLNEEIKLPPRAVTITFDDGFRDNFETAAPILNKYKLKFTVYLTAGYIERDRSPFFVRLRYAFLTTSVKQWEDPISGHIWNLRDKGDAYEAFLTATRYASVWNLEKKEQFTSQIEKILDVSYDDDFGSCLMNWEQVRKLKDDGHTIGGHTLSHPNLVRIPKVLAEEEIINCKKLIYENTGIEIKHFAYPNPVLYPNWNDYIASALNAHGFLSSVTSDRGMVKKNSNAFTLRRISAPADLDEFQWIFSNPINYFL